MVVDAVLGGVLAGEGGVAGVVSPCQDAGVLDVLWEEVGVFEPADFVFPGCPGPADTSAEAVDGYDAAMTEALTSG